MDYWREWRTHSPPIERHSNAALAAVCESYVSAVSLSITAQNTIAARKPQSPRCTIASGASRGHTRLTQPGRIAQRMRGIPPNRNRSASKEPLLMHAAARPGWPLHQNALEKQEPAD